MKTGIKYFLLKMHKNYFLFFIVNYSNIFMNVFPKYKVNTYGKIENHGLVTH